MTNIAKKRMIVLAIIEIQERIVYLQHCDEITATLDKTHRIDELKEHLKTCHKALFNLVKEEIAA